MSNLHTKFVRLQSDLAKRHFERFDEIEIATVALLCGYHTVLVGPPGSDKSKLTRDLCEAIIGATYFEHLMTKFTVPEELFGPVSIAALENGRYERVIEGSAVQASIMFLDEVFKPNSAILNTLLQFMNERTYKHGTRVIQVPLLALFGASNELPESEELGALFDRFHFRKIVKYIEDPSNFAQMLTFDETSEIVSITFEELAQAQQEVAAVETPAFIIETLEEIRGDLNLQGLVVSDRRFRQSLKALRAMAWLSGRDKVSDDDFRILQHMYWTIPQDIKPVTKIILSKTNPLELAADEIIDEADVIAGQLAQALLDQKGKTRDTDKLSKQGVDWFTRCKDLVQRQRELKKKAQAQGKSTYRIDQAQERVARVFKDVARVVGLEPSR